MEDATHLSEIAVVATDGAAAQVQQICDFDASGSAVCTEYVSFSAGNFQTETSTVVSATITLSPVTLKENAASHGSAPTMITSMVVVASFLFGLAIV